MAFPALLDSCVLYPVGVRDLLLSVAERQVYSPYWTEAILDEMARNIVTDGRATAERIAAMREQMNLAFPAARIEGYESLIPAMTNHPKDRHVLAAAVRGSVGLIVTENVRDFPPSACQPYDIDIQTADDFLSYALDQDPPAAVAGDILGIGTVDGHDREPQGDQVARHVAPTPTVPGATSADQRWVGTAAHRALT